MTAARTPLERARKLAGEFSPRQAVWRVLTPAGRQEYLEIVTVKIMENGVDDPWGWKSHEP